MTAAMAADGTALVGWVEEIGGVGRAVVRERTLSGEWSTRKVLSPVGGHADHLRVGVDDAGAGYASLRHVLQLEPEFLKLDRSLVCGIDEDPVRQSLAGAIVALLTTRLAAIGMPAEFW